jgi:7,8-dihydropterin-6-yl-methyl-4-(beta-D-ribofuranosyl)aminobenzene 5'-phosphate synthase
VDNYVDRLEPGGDAVCRFPFSKDGEMLPGPIAEHGFSALVKVYRDHETHSVLFDTGMSQTGVVRNIKALNINLEEVEAIILSHGHIDHSGGLLEVVKEMNRNAIPIILHPDALLRRWIIFQSGERFKMAPIEEDRLKEHGAQFVRITGPYVMEHGLIAVTSEVKRQIDFEIGFPFCYAEVDGQLHEDFIIRDDQGVIVNVKNKGLVVISGCGHAGIINTVLYSQEITGIRNILAIMGGFHLTGKTYEPTIDKTVEAIRKIQPKMLIPCHCTGWKAIHAFARAFPESFVQNFVGTKYIF